MLFRDIVGQEKIKEQLLSTIHEHRVPHAQLFYGPEGSGKLGLAVAYARYLLCKNPAEEDACNVCTSCRQINNKFGHPDLHFSFPVIKAGENPTSDDYMMEWRELLSDTPYFNYTHWLRKMGATTQQPIIYASESDHIQHLLSLKSMEGGYKCLIMWLAEKMNESCANKLLKLLEEPPAQTVFILVSDAPDKLLPTILSRTQQIYVPKLTDEEIQQALIKREMLSAEDAMRVAKLADGNYTKALEELQVSDQAETDDPKLFFELFVRLMRLAYQRKIREMKEWSEEVAGMGRERQKKFLEYCQQMVRENFIFNFRRTELNRMNREEQNFSVRFSPFINEKNAIGIMNELNEAQQHVESNVNAKMIFFDFSLKMIVLLIQK